MRTQLQIEDAFLIGDNVCGNKFAVGRIGERWVGYAHTREMIFLFAEVSDGAVMGMLDKTQAILLTGAVAQDPESAYGVVDRWYVAEDLRGDPDKFRCANCDCVGCQGDCTDDFDYGDYFDG